MRTMCQHGNCTVTEVRSEMICVSGHGYREHYCSWIHAALGCLHRIHRWDRGTPTGATITSVEEQLKEAYVLREKENVQRR